MRFENTKVSNFESAIHGMRNPLASWDKSDSYFGLINISQDSPECDIAELWAKQKHPDFFQSEFMYKDEYICAKDNYIEEKENWLIDNGVIARNGDLCEVAFLGPNDLDLAQRLVKAGSEHRKFMRQILVSVDITAPIYFWKELDTYKIGTTANSTSTMHKLASTPITIDCFEIDDYNENLVVYDEEPYSINSSVGDCVQDFISFYETLRQRYNETKDKRYWKELIRWLPESWLQTRTLTMNYENILSICKQREGHKLTEWKAFIDWAKTLPYANELLFLDDNLKVD
jgi:hypothetical protein